MYVPHKALKRKRQLVQLPQLLCYTQLMRK